MTTGSSKRTSQASTPFAAHARGVRDVITVAILVVFALLMMTRSGSRRGAELMPWPDGLEYAAQAVNLDQGRGAVLHFGGYSYPSRYPEGYPLILAAALPIIGHDVARLYTVTIAIGLCAIVAIYLLALKLFGRQSAILAAILLALCPVFVSYSSLILSDVPAMTVTILAAWELVRATDEEGRPERAAALYATWIILGFITGFSAIMRPTNSLIVGAIVLALIAVPPRGVGIRGMVTAAACFFLALAVLPLLQLHSNALHLGGALSSGYGWWVPEVYSRSGHPFSVSHFFGPTLPRNPHGNVPVYMTALLGLDGMLGDQGDPRYFLYPFPAAAFAVVGIIAALQDHNQRTTRRLVYFGLGLLGLLFAVYIFDLFTETAYLLPGVFIVFITAGYGTVVANRWMRATFGARARSAPKLAAATGVVILDLLLLIALATEISVRLSAEPQHSPTVESLQQIEAKVSPAATIVSNISLQLLELYIPGASRKFVALNSHDPGESFTDYHLNRLFAKRALGWEGSIPQVLFTDDVMATAVVNGLNADVRSADGAYLLLGAPESPDYATLLREQVDQLGAAFTLEPLLQNRSVGLIRLRSHSAP
jgi:4-amino-4-deoxy-L-arabinose transferase-like glycosyltransferase